MPAPQGSLDGSGRHVRSRGLAGRRRRWVVDFKDGSREMRELLGGKGANVAEMTRVLGAERVPAGFTITTEACVAYMGAGAFPDGLARAGRRRRSRGWRRWPGKRLGDADDPLLVSVRSGARESMPGMLDTVLNLGLNDDTVARPRRPLRRRALRLGLLPALRADVRQRRRWASPASASRRRSPRPRRERGVALDTELDADGAARADAPSSRASTSSPTTRASSCAARSARCSTPGRATRAIAYRRINRIPDEWGTAVNVQQMVFGNLGERSGSGVAFSRDEVTGAPEPSGDFLPNAQGEDVVSGVRTPRDIARAARVACPRCTTQLMEILRTLERHYGDMQDTEFTVQEGRLYMLQTRNAKRPAQAAVRFAVDAVAEGLLEREAALLTIDPSSLDALLHPTFDPTPRCEVLATGRGRVSRRGQGRDRR